jgi:ATP adenylyltransferase
VSDKRLWAPWRLEYVTGAEAADPTPLPEPAAWQPGADRNCFLCRDAATYDAAVEADRTLRVAARGRHTMVVLNRYPYNNGHLMVAPLRHVAPLTEITPDEHLESCAWLSRLTRVLGELLHAEGFNIGLNLNRVAGAGCPGHLHWHIVPRWSGDTNFMSAVAGTRVIPQSLDALWELLTAALQQEPPEKSRRDPT